MSDETAYDLNNSKKWQEGASLDGFFQSNEFRLQVHEKRYDAWVASFKLLSSATIALNGGTLAILITSGVLGESDRHINYLAIAPFFLAGCVVFLVSAYLELVFTYMVLTTQSTYRFPTGPDESLNASLGSRRYLKHGAVSLLGVSLLCFVLGAISAFHEFESTAATDNGTIPRGTQEMDDTG